MKKRTINQADNLMLAGIAFFILVFMACMIPVDCHAGEISIPTFGEGKINVRLYADYFCSSCRDMEPDIEPVITELVRDKIVRLMFIDTPFGRYSSLYARYFLYAINENKAIDNVLFARRSLIEAAKAKIDSAQKLEAFFNEKKVGFKPFDVKPTFDTMSRHLKQDTVEKTPTCLIEMNGTTHKYEGGPDITAALDKLRQKKSYK